MGAKARVEWLGTPFAARLGAGLWLGGCAASREPGPPGFLQSIMEEWASSGRLRSPEDPIHQVVLAASLYGGLILFYEYDGSLAPISRRLIDAPLGFGGMPRRVRMALEQVIRYWAALTLKSDYSWLEGLPLEYPGGLALTTSSGPGLESPCAYIEYD